MRTLAKKELESLLISNNEQENRLKIFLLPKDSDDQKNAIVEIRAGTGGLEATLFCADLFKMYEKVCSKKKWLVEIINISKSDAGGFKEVIFSVTGNNIYSYLKYGLVFIEFKEFLTLKHKAGFIPLLQPLQFCLRLKKSI